MSSTHSVRLGLVLTVPIHSFEVVNSRLGLVLTVN